MKENKTKTKLKKGEPVFGVIAPYEDPMIAETIGLIGFDFYMLDGEHGALNPPQAAHIARACEITSITPLARVRSHDPKLLLQFLDAGVMGVMMPGLTTTDEVQAFVDAVRYPPVGTRGLGPMRAADYMLGSMSQAEYVAYANEQILVLPQFEDVQALEALPKMLQVEGVDGFIVGPRDLAMSMGYYDGPKHQEVQQVIEEVFNMVLEAGLILGAVAGSAEAAQKLVDRGARFCLNSVQNLISTSGRTFLSDVHIR